MTPRRTYALAVLCGALLTLAFPEPDVAPLAWVALAPVLFASRDAPPRRAALTWFLFGLGFFGVLLIWISLVGYVAWAMLAILQALFLAVFGFVLSLVTRGRSELVFVLAAVTAWVAVEFTRSLVPAGGFTWGQLAQSQHNMSAWTLRPAALGGGWLVGGLLMGVNACLAVATRVSGRARLVPAGAAVLLLAAPLLLPIAAADGPAKRVAIVQGNVPRDFPGSFYEKELVIARSHARLTESLAGEGVDLIVWPESSVGIDIRRDVLAARVVRDAAQAAGVPLIVGGNLDIDGDHYEVVAFDVEPTGEVTDVYRKTHLVPFGEYVPGRRVLGWIPMLDQVPRDAVPGDEPGVLDVDGTPVAVAISFEGDFSSVARKAVDAGGRLLVVATNTSTWGESWASAQHVAFSQVRAVENGVHVVHAALSGISALIDPAGRIEDRTRLWEATTLTGTVSVATATTLYTRWGDWFPLLCATFLAAAFVTGVLRRRRSTTVEP